MARSCFLCLLLSFALHSAVQPQSVPPLQWLNITNLLQGSAKPIPLKDAVIGYDSISSTVVIFGGESSSGIPQSTTYILNTTSLTWVATNPPTGLTTSPPARSGAISGDDFAASNRHGFVVIGGKGNNNEPLSDVWEFDYGNQFWTQVTITPSDGPSARWGAAGGKDLRSSTITDPIIPGPNNSFYYTGGFDGSSLEPLSDVWRLNISGVLSSNNPTSVSGSWQEISINSFNSLSTQNLSSTMVMDSVAIYGGCATTSTTNISCATQNAYSLDTDTRTSIDPNSCPAPRFGAVMAPNLNSVSATSTQAMLLLGTFNSSLWSDDNGLENGEVAFWDVGAGTWIRVIPSGDPGSSGLNPTPREGSAAVSYTSPIVGSTSGAYSDTLVFGGRDLSGNYLNEVWLLRAYNGAVTSSDTQWSGFGDGTLQTGVNANGAGVDVQFITTCASATSPGSSSSSSSSSTATSGPVSSSGSNPGSSVSTYDTSTVHKILAPLSIALLSSIVTSGRMFFPTFNTQVLTKSMIAYSLSLLVCFGLGIAGLVSAFTSISLISPSSNLSKRSTSTSFHLHTGHGIASLAFFIALFGLLPLLWLSSRRVNNPSKVKSQSEGVASDKQHITSADTAEKLKTTQSRSRTPSRPPSPRPRTHSWGPSILWRPSTDRRPSSDSDSNSSAGPQVALTQAALTPAEAPRTFEVVNRPPRVRRTHMDGTPVGSLQDVDWLQRRRSLNTVDALDYALTEAQRSRERALLLTPATNNAPTHLHIIPQMPDTQGILLHILLQSFILGLIIISIIKLWSSSLAGFIVFLIWTVAFYIALAVLAWNGKPNTSILTVVLARLRAKPAIQSSQELNQYMASQTPLSAPDHYAFPQGSGPYYHEPPFQAASTDLSHGGPRSMETDDDEEDEDARQQRIEGEMDRREIVTVTTVPRRKLWVANPS